MPMGIEHSLPVNVPVSLRTWRNCFLIHWFLREKLAMLGGNVPVSLRTGETASNPLVPKREVRYACGNG